MYSIEFSKKAYSQLTKLSKDSQERILSKLERIRIRPHHFVEKIVGDSGYKLRIGDYRLILDIYENSLIILVLKLGHRKNIYKK